MHRQTECCRRSHCDLAWAEAGEQGKPMHNLGQVVGLYIVVEIAPDVVLNLVVALLGVLHSCVLVLAQPLLHNSLKQIFPLVVVYT